MVGSYALTFPKHMEYFPLWHGATSADGTVAIRHQDEGRVRWAIAAGRSRSVRDRFAWEQRRGDDSPPREGRVVPHRMLVAEAC